MFGLGAWGLVSGKRKTGCSRDSRGDQKTGAGGGELKKTSDTVLVTKGRRVNEGQVGVAVTRAQEPGGGVMIGAPLLGGGLGRPATGVKKTKYGGTKGQGVARIGESCFKKGKHAAALRRRPPKILIENRAKRKGVNLDIRGSGFKRGSEKRGPNVKVTR